MCRISNGANKALFVSATSTATAIRMLPIAASAFSRQNKQLCHSNSSSHTIIATAAHRKKFLENRKQVISEAPCWQGSDEVNQQQHNGRREALLDNNTYSEETFWVAPPRTVAMNSSEREPVAGHVE